VTVAGVFVRGIEREMAGLLSRGTAKEVCVWFRARDYQIRGELIRPCHPGERGARWVYPLTNLDLFLSFTRLGSEGKPFEEQVLSWVRENGLLRRKDYSEGHYSDGTKNDKINQEPMTLNEFRYEVTLANNMLRLFKQLRRGDYDKLRGRISRKRIYAQEPGKVSGYFAGKGMKTARASVVVDGIDTPVDVSADEPLTDDLVHRWAAEAFEFLVEQKLTRMGMIFTQDTQHPRPTSTMLGEVPYRPRLTPRCPDLETALWFQFASLIGDKRPLRECSECEETFVGPERKKTCSPRCRKSRSRRLKKERGS
jgi:hypothetical protein